MESNRWTCLASMIPPTRIHVRQSDRQIAEGKEVTEGNHGFPSVRTPAEAAAEWQPKEGEVTEENLGSPLFVISARLRATPRVVRYDSLPRVAASSIPKIPIEDAERAGGARLRAQRDAFRQGHLEAQKVLRAAEALLEREVEPVGQALPQGEELLGAAAAH